MYNIYNKKMASLLLGTIPFAENHIYGLIGPFQSF